MNDLNILPNAIKKQFIPFSKEVANVFVINSVRHIKRFKKEKIKFIERGVRPSVRVMYHLTDTNSAKKIVQNGFNSSLSYYKAFGKGVNLCPNLGDVIKYRRMRASKSGRVSVIVVKVLIGKAHGNSSNDEIMVRESNGASYSKPEFMMPKRGFDCMYSLDPLKQIWIIPSGSRVMPIAEVELISH